MKVELTVSLALGKDTTGPCDPRLFACIKAIDEDGSLTAASQRLNVSYRYLWGLLERWQQQCGSPLVRLQRGRGATLTHLGLVLLKAQQRIADQLAPDLERLAEEAAAQLDDALAETLRPALKIVASHDLSLGALRELLVNKTGLTVEMQTRGSVDSLSMLRNGQCDIAGFHFSAPLLGTPHLSRLRDLLDDRRHCLIRLVTRRQGLMIAAGNPLNLTGLADVADHQARFINRQSGSGTRLLVDVLLARGEIGQARISGYNNEEFTHLAVAAMIASGAADAGFGIEAAARQFELDFVPVAAEQYWLALDTQRVSQEQTRVLSAILHGHEFQQRIAPLAGYNGAGAGQQVALDEVFLAPVKPL